MNQHKIDEAVGMLVAARRNRAPIAHLPPHLIPQSVAEAHAIQDATTTVLKETAGAFKIIAIPGEEVARGAIFASRVYKDAAEIRARDVPFLGVEAEIAFQFTRDLPPQDQPYQRADILGAVVACPAIEVLDTRYSDFHAASHLERVADYLGNGAFVHGSFMPEWQKLDTLHIHVTLEIAGKIVAEAVGGHMTGDPVVPAVALANHFRKTIGVKKGQMVTTGSFTGLNHAKPGEKVVARFDGLGTAEVTFTV